MKIRRVLIRNFKSIRELDFEIKDINVLIGANGVGKSNFISFFKFLNQVVEGTLSTYVAQKGGADNFLYFGKKQSTTMSLGILFENNNLFNRYSCKLLPTEDEKFIFEIQYPQFSREILDNSKWYTADTLTNGMEESDIGNIKSGIASYIPLFMSGIKIFHFHDTSDTAYVKGFSDINDNRKLREDASNLAAFLYYLQEKHTDSFKQIEKTICRIAPFFDNFILHPSLLIPDKIRLEWKEKDSDKYFNAHHLSDGTLRMICLTTLLLQPNPPSAIIIDEPELGLHPSAINILSGLIQSASEKTQILISTQSVTFINNFMPEDIIVVERRNNQSEFKRLDSEKLEDWLEEYGLGEIWEKNIIGGRP